MENTQEQPVFPMPTAAVVVPVTSGPNLQAIGTLNPVGALMIKDFAKRERQRRETTLTRYHRHLADTYKQDIDFDQLVSVFKLLSDLGLGALITGRGQRTHRFKWGYSLRDVARAADGQIKFEDMAKTPTGPTRIVYSKNYKNKAKRGKVKAGKGSRSPSVKAAKPAAAPVPVAKATPTAAGGVEMMILENGVYKKYEIPQDKRGLFETLLPQLAVAK